MTEAQWHGLGDRLYEALRTRIPIDPLTTHFPSMTLDDAYRISLRMVDRRLQDGERIIGKKIGVTSLAVQRMLDVHQPDFGYLTDRMRYEDGEEVPLSRELIQPRAEGELAFLLRRELRGPGVSIAEVLEATECVIPCFEIVDSRIRDWKIRIQDTVADNASSGVFVLGRGAGDPQRIDFATCRMSVRKNGRPLSTGTGGEALSSPAYCVAWLANTLGALGVSLRAGEIVLSGSLVPLEPVQPGDSMDLEVENIGSATVRFG